jgi:hypothetical protein
MAIRIPPQDDYCVLTAGHGVCGNPTPRREGAEAFYGACLAISPGAVETERVFTRMKTAVHKSRTWVTPEFKDKG